MELVGKEGFMEGLSAQYDWACYPDSKSQILSLAVFVARKLLLPFDVFVEELD